MPDDRKFLEFTQNLRSEIIERSQGYVSDDPVDGIDSEFKENTFTELFADRLQDIGAVDAADICYYHKKIGQGIIKVNGYSVDTEQGVVCLFVSIYRHDDTPQLVPKSEIQLTLNRTIRFFEQAKTGHHRDMEQGLEPYSMVSRIYEVRDKIHQVRIYVLIDGIASYDFYETQMKNGTTFLFHIWDLKRLFRASEIGHEEINIDFIERFERPLNCILMQVENSDYQAYLTIIPGKLLSDLYDEFSTSLLELNVRSFLQLRGKVNQGIRNTIINEPHRFLAYNNGISATAENVKLQVLSEGNSAIAEINNFQIVNGGQTMATIHRSEKIDKADLSKVFVQAKITIVSQEKLDLIVPLISRYANSQNIVNEADFSSNDPIHIEIERFSEKTWAPGEQTRWFYERVRGQYQVVKSRKSTTQIRLKKFDLETPPKQKFTKTDLAKYLNCWDCLPDVASLGPQKGFINFMNRFRNGNDNKWKPDQEFYKSLIGKAILFKSVEKIVREMKFPAYRSNIVYYTVSYISHRTVGRINFKNIWDQQKISDGLEEAIYKWCPTIREGILESAGEKNVPEWCKKNNCWIYISGLKLDIPKALNVELEKEQPLPTVGKAAARKANELSAEDRENIAKVMSIDADTWFRIYTIGLKTELLTKKQCGIAHTFSAYAADNWVKVPSKRQAWSGNKILEIARDQMNINFKLSYYSIIDEI